MQFALRSSVVLSHKTLPVSKGGIQPGPDHRHGISDCKARRVNCEVGLKGALIHGADAGEPGDGTSAGQSVEAFRVSPDALLQGGRHKHLYKARSYDRTRERAMRGKGGYGCRDDGVALVLKELRDVRDTTDVFVAVPRGEAEISTEPRAQHIAVENDRTPSIVAERCTQGLRNGRFSGAR